MPSVKPTQHLFSRRREYKLVEAWHEHPIETGFTYLRARYYDPSTGMFSSVDPAVARTLSAFLYAGNSPLNRLDPLGLWDWGWSSSTWQVIGTVGLVVGVVALAATGVGIVADLGILGGAFAAEGIASTIAVAADTTSVIAGSAGVVTDGLACAGHNDNEACAAALLNGIGVAGGGLGLGFSNATFEGAEGLSRGLGAATAPGALIGYGLDLHSSLGSGDANC